MPTNDRLWLKDFQRVQHLRSQPLETDKQKAINVFEGHPFRRSAPQHVKLVSKEHDFGLQRSPRPEEPEQREPDQPAKIAHQKDYLPIRERSSAVLSLR